MPDDLFRMEKVRKLYGERCVLDVDSLHIARGEILAVVGPSGAGKSTMLRLLNFLEAPSAGRICFDLQWFDASTDPPIATRRRITTVFQRPLLLKRSVRDNVGFGLSLRGKRNSRALVDEVLEAVGLSSLANQDANRLSGGEAQRVALARAMVVHPDVMLLDEPTANLDPRNVAQIEGIIRRLNRDEATTIVLVTHNIFQAKRLADRVAFLLDGELVEAAPVQKFFESPQDERTAAFAAGEMIY